MSNIARSRPGLPHGVPVWRSWYRKTGAHGRNRRVPAPSATSARRAPVRAAGAPRRMTSTRPTAVTASR
ncbi:MAG: hypothetical protein M3144_01470 [Actinomycetota bacterium]|nr:hypothetical protein [Actinomycetota bacterium]